MCVEDEQMTIIYTLGYEGTDVQQFITTLLRAGVKVVADVRAVPLSRKKASRNGDYLNVWRAPALSICILQTSEIHAMAVRQQRLATLRNFITFT
jgi:uncharacterized protein (DUF488 family)